MTLDTCPRCNEKMEKGYMYSPRQIMWSEDNKAKYASLGGDETLVGVPLIKLKKVDAHRCKTCKIVNFMYD